MEASRIKKIMIGVLVSNGSLDTRSNRFDLYSKHEDYSRYLQETFSNLTHTVFSLREKHDKRFGVTGFRVTSTRSKYLSNIYSMFYPNNGRKALTNYTVSRLDEEALAHVWMGNGYLEHAKNRQKDRVQNIGWFCLEAFPKDELNLFRERLTKFGVNSSLVKKPWGFGYRVRIGGEDLQRFISLVYPFILNCFKYKTILFYKRKETALELPSAEHFIREYSGVEDIVRHSQK